MLILTRSCRLNIRTLSRFCSSQVRVRFAPSPTGQLHLGGLRTALYNYLFAKSRNGKFILRIEDTDQNRLVPGAADQLENMLDWVGIGPDESPSKGGNFGPYVQSQRLDLYNKAVQDLIDMGLAYKCFCTEKRIDLMRREAVRTRTNFKYDGRCRILTAAEINEKLSHKLPYTVRFKFDQNAFDQMTFQDLVFGEVKSSNLDSEGDPIIIKSDGFPTYHLANVVDDHYMGISHVLRGQEWQVSTAKHLMLYHAFGWKPPAYGHLPLIMNEDGTKLSKRQADIHLEHYRSEGYFPEAIINFVTLSGGAFKDRDQTGNTIYSLPEFVNRFDLSVLKTHSCQVNFDLLEGLNQKVLKIKLSNPDTAEQILQEARTILKTHFASTKGQDIIPEDSTIKSQLTWAKNRLVRLKDLTLPEFSFLWVAPTHISYEGPVTSKILAGAVRSLETLPNEQFSSLQVSDALRQYSKSVGIKFPVLMKCLRTVLSGLNDGPPVGEMIQLLGKPQTLKRMQLAAKLLSTKSTKV